jgi:hypothetical protein
MPKRSFSNLLTLKSKLSCSQVLECKLISRVKRAKEKKTKRAKTIKQLTAMGRRHLLGVRVVMKNMVYVVGMKLPAATPDEVCYRFRNGLSSLRIVDIDPKDERVFRTIWKNLETLHSRSLPTLFLGSTYPNRRPNLTWNLHRLRPSGRCSSCHFFA